MKYIHKILLDTAAGGAVRTYATTGRFIRALDLQVQGTRLALWYEVGDQVKVNIAPYGFDVVLVETGAPCPPDGREFVYAGTAQFDGGRYVLHAYVRGAAGG